MLFLLCCGSSCLIPESTHILSLHCCIMQTTVIPQSQYSFYCYQNVMLPVTLNSKNCCTTAAQFTLIMLVWSVVNDGYSDG